jgi:hypothetical protein
MAGTNKGKAILVAAVTKAAIGDACKAGEEFYFDMVFRRPLEPAAAATAKTIGIHFAEWNATDTEVSGRRGGSGLAHPCATAFAEQVILGICGFATGTLHDSEYLCLKKCERPQLIGFFHEANPFFGILHSRHRPQRSFQVEANISFSQRITQNPFSWRHRFYDLLRGTQPIQSTNQHFLMQSMPVYLI